MVKEFEGKTEKEAIDNAIAALSLDREEFDVEIVESSKKGFFKKGAVKIRVHVSDEFLPESAAAAGPVTDEEKKIIEFLSELLEKMGYPGDVDLSRREDSKVILKIASDHSGILIGKKGKNLDALQVLLNVFASKIGVENRIVVDTENYRSRREESIIQMATKVAEQVRRSRGSRLLEPMNPFERRLVHTTLNEFPDIDTKSEGEGLYKQVRVIYRGTAS
jgi:spoIIIJ-associated protein